MAILRLTDDQMRTALKELEQAAYNHDQWAENLYGTLICRLIPDDRDMSRDAHEHCRFGQWYHKVGGASFKNHPGFPEIGLEHERMHQYASSLLAAAANGAPISIQDYERFVTALKRLRLEIATVRRDLERTLFNLDPLTGTPNRLEMLDKLREQQEFVRRGHTCVVAMMDLDRFKAVNDAHGHLAGDKVLVGISQYTMAHLRPYDRLFRYGGEEFLMCLADTDTETARVIMDRLRSELASLPFTSNGGPAFNVTVSIGLAALEPEAAVERSIERADLALYAAKQAGRNRITVWDESMADVSAPDSKPI
jgi:diguanylate cyclase